MASTDNPAREPVENETVANTPATISDESAPSAPASTPASPPPARLADSQLEAAHAELPPLSRVSDGNSVEATAARDTGSIPSTRPSARRGLKRGTAANGKTAAAQPDIGAVDDTAAISENLSGQYANGYGNRPERPARPERSERPERSVRPERFARPARPENDTAPVSDSASQPAETGPREFIPPVSQETYKAEMNPERERQAREDKRRERRERDGDRPDRQNRREYFGERREDKPAEWNPPRNGGNPRQKLIIEPAKIPEQPDESLLGRIKRFFSGLFGSDESAKNPPRKNTSGNNREDRNGNRRGGRGRHRDRSRGEFRNGSRGDRSQQNPNRDGRQRPYTRGGYNRPSRGED